MKFVAGCLVLTAEPSFLTSHSSQLLYYLGLTRWFSCVMPVLLWVRPCLKLAGALVLTTAGGLGLRLQELSFKLLTMAFCSILKQTGTCNIEMVIMDSMCNIGSVT